LKLLTAAFLAALPFALSFEPTARAEIVQGQTFGQQEFGNWAGVLAHHGNDVRFRAYTISGNWALYFDILPPKCLLTVSTILSIGTDTMQADIAPFDFMATARVDQNDPFDWRFQAGATMGDQGLLFTGYALSGIQALLEQMENGQVLRLKLAITPNQPSYATFALNGFGNALKFETNQCMSLQQQTQKRPGGAKKSAPTKPPPPATNVL
jgi:hypothetical protein